VNLPQFLRSKWCRIPSSIPMRYAVRPWARLARKRWQRGALRRARESQQRLGGRRMPAHPGDRQTRALLAVRPTRASKARQMRPPACARATRSSKRFAPAHVVCNVGFGLVLLGCMNEM
jgi:hypothetical protein